MTLSTGNRKTQRWKKAVLQNEKERARIRAKNEMLEKAKLRRRYVGEFNKDINPEDPRDLFLPRVKKAARWRS